MIDQFQFYLGIQKPFLTLPSTQYQYSLKSYIKYIWDACTEVKLQLYLSNLYIPRSRYLNDHFVMKVFINHKYSEWKLRRLNNVRIWKKIIFISDMFDQQTRKIYHWVLSIEHQNTDHHHWPKRRQPTKQDINLWKEAINLCFCKGQQHSLYETSPLLLPLAQPSTVLNIPSLTTSALW